MWVYEQVSGKLFARCGALLAQGYSGNGVGKNNPSMQAIKGVGPIPIGTYTIQAPQDNTGHGPFAMRLTQDDTNQMFGRSGFMMHGDNIHAPGTASEGCIIMPRDARERVWNSGDNRLEVIYGEDDVNNNAFLVQQAAAGK